MLGWRGSNHIWNGWREPAKMTWSKNVQEVWLSTGRACQAAGTVNTKNIPKFQSYQEGVMVGGRVTGLRFHGYLTQGEHIHAHKCRHMWLYLHLTDASFLEPKSQSSF